LAADAKHIQTFVEVDGIEGASRKREDEDDDEDDDESSFGPAWSGDDHGRS